MTRTDWKLRFAPHTGFRDPAQPLFLESAGSPDPVAQIAYIADLGFAGIEDNNLLLRPLETQQRIGEALARHGLEMGCFTFPPEARNLCWGSEDAATREALERHLRLAIEGARRVDGRLIVVSSARDLRVPLAYELSGMTENLKRLAPIAEKAGVVLCLEHVNAPRIPDRLLQHVADSYAMARAVGSPAVSIVFDFVHVQIMDGDIIANIDRCWERIGVFQLGDVGPAGRCEPGSGEINWVNVLRHVKRRGFTGLLELEHVCEQPGREGEQLALARLREINAAI
jgi:hydroxypyruvate isomerase